MSTTNNQTEGNASALKKDCEVKRTVEPPPLEVKVPLARSKLALAAKATIAEVPQTASRRSSDCSDLSTELVDDPTFDVTIETQFPIVGCGLDVCKNRVGVVDPCSKSSYLIRFLQFVRNTCTVSTLVSFLRCPHRLREKLESTAIMETARSVGIQAQCDAVEEMLRIAGAKGDKELVDLYASHLARLKTLLVPHLGVVKVTNSLKRQSRVYCRVKSRSPPTTQGASSPT